MTTITTTAADTATALAPGGSGAGFLTATGQTARRTMLQFLRTPQLLLMPPILGALFLFIFRYIFGGAISTGTDVDYVDFLVSGFLVQTVLWTAMNIPAGVAEDAASGVYDRLRSLPIPRAAVMAGRSLADTSLNAWAITVTALLGVAVFPYPRRPRIHRRGVCTHPGGDLRLHLGLHQPRPGGRQCAGRPGHGHARRRAPHVRV
jgi:ABC-2 type transport system permease protein